MTKEMNNLKVLGLMEEQNDFVTGKAERNTLWVEDVQNKAQYYIHIDSKEQDRGNDKVFLSIEPVKERKVMTHLPKEETFIEDFDINPKTLSYTYIDAGYSGDLLDDYEDEDSDFSHDDEHMHIDNNVFSYEVYNEQTCSGETYIKEGIFVPNPELPTHEVIKANEELKRIRSSLHRGEEVDTISSKKAGNIAFNKALLEEKYLGDIDDDKLALKHSGDTRYNKHLMKIFKNKKQR